MGVDGQLILRRHVLGGESMTVDVRLDQLVGIYIAFKNTAYRMLLFLGKLETFCFMIELDIVDACLHSACFHKNANHPFTCNRQVMQMRKSNSHLQ